jgi:hypothetical protein
VARVVSDDCRPPSCASDVAPGEDHYFKSRTKREGMASGLAPAPVGKRTLPQGPPDGSPIAIRALLVCVDRNDAQGRSNEWWCVSCVRRRDVEFPTNMRAVIRVPIRPAQVPLRGLRPGAPPWSGWRWLASKAEVAGSQCAALLTVPLDWAARVLEALSRSSTGGAAGVGLRLRVQEYTPLPPASRNNQDVPAYGVTRSCA